MVNDVFCLREVNCGVICQQIVKKTVAFSQCGIAYWNVLVMKNIENKIMNYEQWKTIRFQEIIDQSFRWKHFIFLNVI